jgi:hypothetical protein
MVNESFNHLGGWNSWNLSQNNVIFSISVIATILHFHLWSQLIIHKIKFDLSFMFPVGYISTDIFLLLFYFIQYSIRIRSWIPVTRLSCYFEAYSMFYFNIFELYCLAALNICRYWQIVRNQNIYKFHRRKLILISVIVPLLVLVNMIIQDIFGWCVVLEIPGESCTFTYTNIIVRVWNLGIMLITPILISFYMLFQTLYFLQNSHAQQVLLRRNHHRQLTIHSGIFYSIWLTLWFPLMIIIYLGVDAINESIVFVALLANTLEVLIDPIISIFLDKRFAQAWKKFHQSINRQFGWHMNARVAPNVPMATVGQTNTLTYLNR